MQTLCPDADRIVREALPLCAGASASIAIVKDGRLAAQAYGCCRRVPYEFASVQTRYAIGSVAKQFTAAAALLLERDGVLSLDDPLSRWLAWPTGADQVTLRALLSHTAGFEDYYSHRHAPPGMLEDTTPLDIGLEWGRRPLEFAPGQGWSYSNTGYVLAGLALEKASGRSLSHFLADRIFGPLGLAGAGAYDGGASAGLVAEPLTRVGLAAARRSLVEGAGWLFAAAGLAMRAYDLALWNRALLQSVPSMDGLLEALSAPVAQVGARSYGLGLAKDSADGHRVVSHGGQVQGFLGENRTYPDHGLAITVLTNTDAGTGCVAIADRVAFLLLPRTGPASIVVEVFDALRAGRPEERHLTSAARRLFTPPLLAEFSNSLNPLGPVRAIRLTDEVARGGMAHRQYAVTFADGRLVLRVAVLPDGRLDELHAFADP